MYTDEQLRVAARKFINGLDFYNGLSRSQQEAFERKLDEDARPLLREMAHQFAWWILQEEEE